MTRRGKLATVAACLVAFILPIAVGMATAPARQEVEVYEAFTPIPFSLN